MTFRAMYPKDMGEIFLITTNERILGECAFTYTEQQHGCHGKKERFAYPWRRQFSACCSQQRALTLTSGSARPH